MLTKAFTYGSVILAESVPFDHPFHHHVPELITRIESLFGQTAYTTELSASAPWFQPGLHALIARIVGYDYNDRTSTAHVSLRVQGDTTDSWASLELKVSGATTVSNKRATPGTRSWSTQLAQALGRDPEFSRLIETYDGTIGLTIGSAPVHIRCYRGKVVEIAPRSVNGADFTVEIPVDVYLDLVERNSNDFMTFAMERKFRTHGSGYEYLRMTTALIRIIDIARALHEENHHD